MRDGDGLLSFRQIRLERVFPFSSHSTARRNCSQSLEMDQYSAIFCFGSKEAAHGVCSVLFWITTTRANNNYCRPSKSIGCGAAAQRHQSRIVYVPMRGSSQVLSDMTPPISAKPAGILSTQAICSLRYPSTTSSFLRIRGCF